MFPPTETRRGLELGSTTVQTVPVRVHVQEVRAGGLAADLPSSR